jgi:hypothetical protein
LMSRRREIRCHPESREHQKREHESLAATVLSIMPPRTFKTGKGSQLAEQKPRWRDEGEDDVAVLII